jgi:hypothetical protein
LGRAPNIKAEQIDTIIACFCPESSREAVFADLYRHHDAFFQPLAQAFSDLIAQGASPVRALANRMLSCG